MRKNVWTSSVDSYYRTNEKAATKWLKNLNKKVQRFD